MSFLCHLLGEWSRTDVKSAHHSVLKDRARKVIIIILGDLPSKDLDPDIRLYLKNHTYLNASNDKKFWDKLKYALPDVRVKAPIFRGTNGRSSSHYNSSQVNQNAHRSAPPVPPPHYQYALPQPPTSNQLQQQYQSQSQYHQSSPSVTSSHHHLLNSVNNSANNTLHQHNLMNSLNSVIPPNGMNVGMGMGGNHPMTPNIVPLVSSAGGSGSLRQSSQQRQYHTIVNSTLNNGNPNNRHNAVHI